MLELVSALGLGDLHFTSTRGCFSHLHLSRSFRGAFQAKRLWRFTPEEIAWLQEEFSKVDAEEDSNRR